MIIVFSSESVVSVQIGFEAQATDGLNAEVEYEYDDQLDEFVLEEAIVELDWGISFDFTLLGYSPMSKKHQHQFFAHFSDK